MSHMVLLRSWRHRRVSPMFSCSLILDLMISACGAQRLSPAGSTDAVSVARGTRGVIAPSRQFVAYVPAAERLTVIDQATEGEAYGVDFSQKVHATFPVAQFDGIAALTDGGLAVFSEGLTRSFRFAYGGGDWDAASDAAAFAFAESGGVRIIRHLEGETWQDQTLDALTPQGSDAPLLSPDGRRLVILRPDDGSYATYRAERSSSPLVAHKTCPALATLSSPIVALAFLEGTLFWGDTQGSVGSIDTATDPCQNLTTQASLPGGEEIARILPLSTGDILVFAVGGGVFTWNGATRLTPYITLESCDFPLAPQAFADDALGALCLNKIGTASTTRTILYDQASYNVYSKSAAAPVSTIPIPLGDTAALGIDKVTQRLFILASGGLGQLTTVDLATGSRRVSRGIFIKNLLEK